ncbi:BIG1-domain-containing protein [Massarina eburnea CBS 473.64]|uniref:Protein BIG1 n=1 Tax=Massarina eburnea CBS 473.64 TaxID=1395130 RepID=A0A6A6S8Y7_9PLEO|nr:BIG1-domain-containing protein [Massarina eburnea CBS 473.64]
MAKILVGALALASIPSALAFRDTSPFFLFSTAELLIPGADNEIAHVDDATGRIKDVLKSCPTKWYVVMEQTGVVTDDYRNSHSTPRLSHYLGGKEQKVRSTLVVPEVVGRQEGSLAFHESSAQALSEYIREECGAEVRISTDISDEPHGAVGDVLQSFDAILEDRIVDQAYSDDYTVIYTTTLPTESRDSAKKPTYEMENPFSDAVQMEMKRDLSSHRRAVAKTEGALFERYEYFSPGIFMAFFAIIPMLSIIFVGLKALTSLEVSYFAFSKEMGPTAQRKQ